MNGQRHGVPLRAMRAFVQGSGLLQETTSPTRMPALSAGESSATEAVKTALSADTAAKSDETIINLIDSDEEEELPPLAVRLAMKRKLGA